MGAAAGAILEISQAYEILNQLPPSMRLAGSTMRLSALPHLLWKQLLKFNQNRILICRASQMLGSSDLVR